MTGCIYGFFLISGQKITGQSSFLKTIRLCNIHISSNEPKPILWQSFTVFHFTENETSAFDIKPPITATFQANYKPRRLYGCGSTKEPFILPPPTRLKFPEPRPVETYISEKPDAHDSTNINMTHFLPPYPLICISI